MRDGSLDDVVGMWIDGIVEEHGGRNPGDNEAAVYFSLMKRAATSLLQLHAEWQPGTDYREAVDALLSFVRLGLEKPEQASAALEAFREPELAELGASPETPSVRPGRAHAGYWESDSWKKDFYVSLNRYFWDMKDYAQPAGRRKSDFLWELAEIWVVVAASAMVFYAKGDRERWFETAQMLRHYADMTEADGLRSLPWGRWGRYSHTNREPHVRT